MSIDDISNGRYNAAVNIAGEHFRDATDNRPTLDQEAVKRIVRGALNLGKYHISADAATDEIMALTQPNPSAGLTGRESSGPAPAAEGWPEWLGPKIDPDDFEVTRRDDGEFVVNGELFGYTGLRTDSARCRVPMRVEEAAKLEAIARFIESEQAATDDEDQRVENVARKLAETMNPASDWPDDWAWEEVEAIRHAARAGWTPPESEAE